MRIGELLVAEGLLTETAVNRALGFQRLSGERVKIGSILLDWDLLAEDALLATLAKFHRCPAVDWPTLAAAPFEVVSLLSAAQAARFSVIAYALERATLRVAFVDPSNLAAADEISAITRKRIAPAVATEVRLLQAHQKFYGRHIPGGVRTIVQKLERKTGHTRRSAQLRPPVDFRAPDLTRARAPIPLPIEPDFESLSPPELPGIAAAESSTAEPRAALPPQTPIDDAGPSTPASEPNVSWPSEKIEQTPAPEDPIKPDEDSLSEWVGDALASFGQTRSHAPLSKDAGARHAADATADSSGPSSEQVASDMWRPSRIEEAESLVEGMWSPGEEAGPQFWEARSRDEIGQAVLQNALTELPRVLLFSAGKSAATGWQGRGPGLSAAQIGAIRVPTAERSPFATVIETGVPHFGPVEQNEWPASLAKALGPQPPDCAIFPIRVLDGIAAFLYADRLGHPMQYQDFALIARAAASTANVVTRFLLRSNTAPVGP